jgi:hypothetical protein
MDANTIQNDIKQAVAHFIPAAKRSESNVAMWALCKKLDSDVKKLVKDAVNAYKKTVEIKSKEAECKLPEKRMTDEERKEMLELKLDAMLTDPKTTAADIKEFRDYFGLGGKKSDTFVNTIDYKDAFPADADRIKCVAELIKMRIEEVNQ